jgi:hypothetical protein
VWFHLPAHPTSARKNIQVVARALVIHSLETSHKGNQIGEVSDSLPVRMPLKLVLVGKQKSFCITVVRLRSSSYPPQRPQVNHRVL